jgi:hypothetical protein
MKVFYRKSNKDDSTLNNNMITQYSFGKIVINNVAYTNDIKIVQGRVVSNWWRKRGHRVDVDDIKDILEATPNILVIGRGQPGLMKSTDSLRQYLENHGIELVEEKTPKAVQTFNRLLKEGKDVCAGIHIAC